MVWMALLMAGTAHAQSPPRGADSTRSQDGAATERNETVSTWFPSGTLFGALAADLKEPRSYASFRRTQYSGEAPVTLEDDGGVTAALLGLGTEFGIWGQRNGNGDGLQVGIAAGVFTQFDMSTRSPAMLNADYLVGPQFTYRDGNLGVRTRLIHQSSHAGDGLLRRAEEMGEELEERGPSMEWIDALAFFDGPHVRVYGTTRYVLQTITPLEPWQAAGGVELRATGRRWGGLEAQPFAAFHVEVLEARAWGSTRSAVAGISLHRGGQSRGFRISAVYQNGFTPFGRFFTTVRLQSYGIQLEFLQ